MAVHTPKPECAVQAVNQTELAAAVNLLTRDSKHRIADGDGKLQFVTVSPLLVQLRLAIANSTAAGSFGNGGGAVIPLAAAALDLYSEIRETVREQWWLTHELHHGHGKGKLVPELRAWASVAAGQEDLLTDCYRYCASWVSGINGLLQPVRRWEVRGACPECQVDRVLISQDEGTVWGPALSIVITESETWAECLHCGERYVPEHLARRLLSE